jgi:L-methionine (R)-S-oxide reductase
MEAVSRFDPAAVAARVAAFRASSSAIRVDVSSIASSTPTDVSPELAASLSSYRIPKVTEDGTCSLPDQLEPLPFDVLDEVVARSAPAPSSPSPSSSSSSSVRGRELRRLAVLRRVCEALQASTGAEWVGIYETVADGRRLAGSAAAATAAGGGAESCPPPPPPPPSLLKLAYVGSPSRPFFPLTPEFAESSNNSTVAMTGSTVVIHDVRRMPRDTAYYQCDPLVKAEVCAPLPRPWAAAAGGEGGEGRGPPAMGIIDAESWTADSFTPERVDAILDVCAQLAELRLLRGEGE